MNMVLKKLQLYKYGYGDICSVEELLDISIKEIKRLRIIEEHRDILAIHMAEVKAIVEGTRQNTLKQVVGHCIEELGSLPMKTSKVSQNQIDIPRCVVKKNDSMVEFKGWDKITRHNPFKATITEKIDGTNACIIIQDGEIIGVQSRKRLITVDNDNYGFARWVEENKDDLIKMGEGYHYGEWAGLGIQKNPLKLDKKHLFLFNTSRWDKDNPDLPKCCDVVPILYQGELKPDTIPNLLEDMKKDKVTREGVVVYYPAFRKYTKHTIDSPNGKWCK